MEYTTLQLIWFLLIGVLWTGYLVLEGFDFGVGMLMPALGPGRDAADTERRKRVMLTTIGPHWDGNEVWLLTAGGPSDATMVFPVLAYYGMQTQRIGEAAAVSVYMLPVLAILVIFATSLMMRREE